MSTSSRNRVGRPPITRNMAAALVPDSISGRAAIGRSSDISVVLPDWRSTEVMNRYPTTSNGAWPLGGIAWV